MGYWYLRGKRVWDRYDIPGLPCFSYYCFPSWCGYCPHEEQCFQQAKKHRSSVTKVKVNE